MANPKPLQAGDRSQNLSDNIRSEAADRRPPSTSSVQDFNGSNGASQKGEPFYPLFPGGTVEKSSFLSPPWPVVNMEGDTSGTGTEIFELDTQTYGDCYDPTAPMRVRTVDNYTLDSDHDGHLN